MAPLEDILSNIFSLENPQDGLRFVCMTSGCKTLLPGIIILLMLLLTSMLLAEMTSLTFDFASFCTTRFDVRNMMILMTFKHFRCEFRLESQSTRNLLKCYRTFVRQTDISCRKTKSEGQKKSQLQLNFYHSILFINWLECQKSHE